MIKLFHGSHVQFDTIDLSKGRPYKDFGKGFYLTDLESQAKQMAQRVSIIYGGEPCVQTYSFDLQLAKNDEELKIKTFDYPSEEWALFVMSNRNRKVPHPTHYFDIVIGPVADDEIATLFRNFEKQLINLDQLVQGLKYKHISSQYLFHTERSLKYLKKL